MTARSGGGTPGVGLRTRVTAAFALGALLLSTVLVLAGFGFSRSYLLRQRESAGVRQAVSNAESLAAGLRDTEADVPKLLEVLPHVVEVRTFLFRADGLYGSSVGLGQRDLPAGLLARVDDGTPALQRFSARGTRWLAVGVPLPDGSSYVEVSQLRELDRTLRTISGTLAAAAVLTTLAGAALGFATSRRVLRPLRQVSGAAADLGGGRLGTRLPEIRDRDLAPLVESFNRMADTLQSRLERDARFAADVSHELRSPLTTLATSVAVLEGRRDEMSERARRAVDLIAGEVQRFERLVEDLLEISVAQRSGRSLDAEPVAIGELVRQCVGAAAPVTVSAAAERAVVLAEKRRLERVIANLVTNARTHGGGLLEVRVLCDGAHARIEVDDAGPGVAVDDRERIFEPFHRAAASGHRRADKGVGLGLSLVAEHVRAHGGRVSVEDRPGGGTRFVVELPTAARP